MLSSPETLVEDSNGQAGPPDAVEVWSDEALPRGVVVGDLVPHRTF